MQYGTTSCQLPRPRKSDSPRISTPQDEPSVLVRDREQQHIDTTASRRTGPRKWLRAVEWAVSAGHHPRANATTLELARDLAARMDYDTGHARYCLDATAARLGVDRSTVKRHAKHLRELGLLAWVVNGTKTNVRRALGIPGYAATATIYAATIPAYVDQAMGRTTVGTGYTARVIVDMRGQQTPPQGALQNTTATKPEDACAPPSLTVVKKSGSVQVECGVTTTAERADKTSSPTTQKPKNASSKKRAKRTTILGRIVTASGIRRGHQLARAIRTRLTWTRRSSHNQIRWIAADMAEQGWTIEQAVAWVAEAGAINGNAGLLWHPERPHALLAQALRDEQQTPAAGELEQQAPVRQPWEHAEWVAMVHGIRTADVEAAEAAQVRTDDDRRAAQAAGRYDLQQVIDHLEQYGDDDAIDLYGTALAARAAGLAASASFRAGAFA